MKLNPFHKKSTAYYDKVKADHEELSRQLAAVQNELAEAEAEYAREREKQTKLREAAGSMSMNTPPAAKAHWPILCAAHQRLEALKSRASSLERQMQPLQHVLNVPQAFAQAKKDLTELLARRAACTAELETTDSQIAKLDQRIAALEARLAAETKAASQTLLTGDDEFVVPDALTRLEVELRIARTSLADLHSRRETANAKLAELPALIRQAERAFIHCRADLAEVELYEQLMPVMNALARASAARRQCNDHHIEGRFQIEIPMDMVQAAQSALAAEMPAT